MRASWKVFHRIYNSRDCTKDAHGNHLEASSKSSSIEENIPPHERVGLSSPDSPTNAQQLKMLCSKGQQLAIQAGELRAEITKLKGDINLTLPQSQPDEVSMSLRQNLFAKHAEYNSLIVELKAVKAKIEQVQKQISLHGPNS